MNIDIQELKDNIDIVEIIGQYVDLKERAHEYHGCCPFHDENTPSFTVSPQKGFFKCFGCGETGDVIAFIQKYKNLTFQEAIKELGDPLNVGAIPHGGPKKASKKKIEKGPEWKHIIPGVKNDTMFKHWVHGEPTKTWPYLNEKSELVGYACRFLLPDGKKEVLPLIFAEKEGHKQWMYRGFSKPRPLFNLNQISNNLKAPILIVEGEKTAAAAEELFPNTVVTTFPGGSNGIKHVEWSHLKGRTVVLWPDNDMPGFKAMHEVYKILKPLGCTTFWIKNPPMAKKGWDVADSGWTIGQAKEYVDNNSMDYPGIDYQYQPSDQEIVQSALKQSKQNKSTPAPPSATKTKPGGYKGDEWFKILGVAKENNGMMYHFYAYTTKTVIGLTPGSMTKNNLMQLAPFEWWCENFTSQSANQPFSLDKATDHLIDQSSRYGVFSDKWLRGRGAWIDKKRVFIHAGDKLFIDGKETPLSDYKSKYIYELGPELEFDIHNPLPKEESAKLIDLISGLNWERSINTYLLLGWCVVAPICGALDWRPHIWLTGSSGTGKSTIFKKVVRELLGETCLAVQGETSEAGLRQTLGHDALPVVFDEAEGEDRRAQDRMQTILALMRASSSSDGGLLAKGSAGGSAKTFRIRSCFAFASIAVQLQQQSDKRRVTVLGLKRPQGDDAKAKWASFQEKYNKLINPAYTSSLRARTINMLPIILKNIKTFGDACTAVIGEQSAGDQVGVLLAGAWSLVSDKEITYDNAVKWVKAKNWDEEIGLSETRDELSLIAHIFEQEIWIDQEKMKVERSVGEVVRIALGLRKVEWGFNERQANDRLKRLGIKIKDDCVIVSNSDNNIRGYLVGTPWARNHNKILLRLDGAKSTDSQRFASGIQTRAVSIPSKSIFGDLEPEMDPVAPTVIKSNEDLFKADREADREDDHPF